MKSNCYAKCQMFSPPLKPLLSLDNFKAEFPNTRLCSISFALRTRRDDGNDHTTRYFVWSSLAKHLQSAVQVVVIEPPFLLLL